MKEIRLARKIITTLIKDSIHYPGAMIVQAVSLLARCGLLLVLYHYVFELKGGTIAGVTFPIVAWSMFFYFLFSVLLLRRIAEYMMQDIQSGNIEVLLTRPISYLSYRMWWQVGLGAYSFLFLAVVATAAMVCVVGIPATMSLGIFIPTFVITFLLSAILSLFLYSIIGFLAFWIEDVKPVFWLIDKSVMILGGSFLPVALFPDFMYKIAIYSPMGASQFISHTVYASWQSEWGHLVSIQATWIVILGLIMGVMFGRAKKNVSVNGG